MTDKAHPIRVAASRAGLTPDVLRAWEKRYGAVQPRRSEGRRLYDEEDIQRLILLRRATLAGRRIGDVAALPLAELQQMEESDRQAMANAPGPAPGAQPERTFPSAETDPEAYRTACMQAVKAFDGDGFSALLDQAAVALGEARLLDEVILPVIKDMGELWRHGSVRIAQEHLASEVLQTCLNGLREAQTADSNAPRIVITTLPGQHHELGALVAAAAAASEGWKVSYIGPNLPTAEIAAAVIGLKARAVAVSLVYPADDPRLGTYIETLRRQIGNKVALLVGGSAAGSYADSLKASGAIHLRGMASLRAFLTSLRMQAPAPPASV